MRSIKLHMLLSALVLVITLLLGFFTTRFHANFDVTSNQRHSLSDATVATLNALQSPVEIIAVLGPDAGLRNGVSALITRFQSINDQISLRFVNPETQPAEARALAAAPGGELIVRTGEREQRLQNLSERSLSSALMQLGQETNRSVAFITGHNERSPLRTNNDDWQIATQSLEKLGVVATEWSLVSDPVIPDSVDLVVIAASQTPFFLGEIASLLNHVNAGGNLLWLLETPIDNERGPGLVDLANNLGITDLPGKVIDTASQVLAADSPDFVLLDRFPAHPVTASMTSPVLLPQTRAFTIDALAGQEHLPLLVTPESSWTETGELSGEVRFDDNSNETAGPLLLGVTIERNNTQRIAVIGDADFGASQFIGNGSNQAFTDSLILWLSGDADAIEFVTQRASDSELRLDNRSIIILTAVLLAVLPLLILIIGLLVRWRHRRA